jgi:hypothetical protein
MKNFNDLSKEKLVEVLTGVFNYVDKNRIERDKQDEESNKDDAVKLSFDIGFEQGVNCLCNALDCILNELTDDEKN